MLKEERFEAIVALVDRKGTIKVANIMEALNVSDMTIRRDLTELDQQGRVKRIHGGAKSVNTFRFEELSHDDKQIVNISEKREVAKKSLELIEEGDTIFLGPGTTIEIMAEMMTFNSIRVVTNSLPVFNILNNKKNGDLVVYLLGGEIRTKTKAFFGEITNLPLMDMHFSKAFVGCNAVHKQSVMTATIEEGKTQSLALGNSNHRYLLIDASKLGKEDFYSFYNLKSLTAVIINRDDFDSHKILEKDVKVIV